jgi:hypothetical protein
LHPFDVLPDYLPHLQESELHILGWVWRMSHPTLQVRVAGTKSSLRNIYGNLPGSFANAMPSLKETNRLLQISNLPESAEDMQISQNSNPKIRNHNYFPLPQLELHGNLPSWKFHLELSIHLALFVGYQIFHQFPTG